MAGSWNHAVDKETGKLLVNKDLNGMLENGGDVYEFAEEVYGMVYWLAEELSKEVGQHSTGELVEFARQNYKDGLKVSPGTDGHLPEDDI